VLVEKTFDSKQTSRFLNWPKCRTVFLSLGSKEMLTKYLLYGVRKTKGNEKILSFTYKTGAVPL